MVALLPEISLYVFWFVAPGVGTEKLSVSCIKAQSTYPETKVVLCLFVGTSVLAEYFHGETTEFKFPISIYNMISITSSLAGKP